MSEETDVKLKCLQIAAEASSRIGQYTPSKVLEQAKGWYEWVRDRGQKTEDRGQTPEDGGQKTEDRGQKNKKGAKRSTNSQ